jgi:hypothetical protein
MYFTCHAALVALLGLLFGMWHVEKFFELGYLFGSQR